MHKRRNRKTVIKDGWISYKDERLEICNSQKYGVYKQTILAFIDQLDASIAIHKRVLVLRVDFRVNYYTDTNKKFSTFMKNIKQWIERNYDIYNIGYQWVREQETAKKQHYHLALILDGNKIQHPAKLNEVIKEKWLSNGSIYKPDNGFYYIDKHNYQDERPKAIYRVSYMAKSRGKGARPAQTKDYYSSRLNIQK
jgi:hypothetical protein